MNKVKSSSNLKYLWFHITYDYFSLKNIAYFRNKKYYNPNSRGGGGGLLSLILHGREEEIFYNRVFLISKYIDDIVDDGMFKQYITNNIFGKCAKIYIKDQESKMKNMMNDYENWLIE
jgi:hypothetical protein